MQPMTPFRRRPIWGMAMGIVLGGIYTLFLVIPDLVLDLDGFQDLGGSAGSAFQLFLFGGATGGLVAGTLLPEARTRLGAVCVGAVAIFPFFFAQSHLQPPEPGGPTPLPLWLVVLLSLFVGGFVGYLVRERMFGHLAADD